VIREARELAQVDAYIAKMEGPRKPTPGVELLSLYAA
jgi:hypothetical protein